MADLIQQRLDPRSMLAARIGGWIVTAVVLVVAGGVSLYALIRSGAPSISWIGMGAILAVIGGLLLTAAWIGPLWSYRSTLLTVDDAGLVVPGDFSITGVVARHWAEDFRPPLTAADVPAQDMGAEAVALLLQQIANPEAVPHHHLVCPPISLRGSTGPAPQH